MGFGSAVSLPSAVVLGSPGFAAAEQSEPSAWQLAVVAGTGKHSLGSPGQCMSCTEAVGQSTVT